MADLGDLREQFDAAADSMKLQKPDDKLQTLCREIIDHPEFKNYVTQSHGSYGPEYTLRTAFNTLNADQTFQGLMAFIQTDGALAMAKDTRPEDLVDFLGETQKKMSADDKELFNMFLWSSTRTGKALLENYPAAPLKMKLAGMR